MIGDRQSAFRHLEKALKIAPLNGEVLFRAAIVHHHFNEIGQALSYLKKRPTRVIPRTVIRDTPDFGDLQQEPQFRSLVSTTSRSHRPRLDMHSERPRAVVTALIVDRDAAVVVGVVHACRSWRSRILGGSLWAVHRAVCRREWTTGKLDIELRVRSSRAQLVGDILVILHIDDPSGVVLGALAVTDSQRDG